MKRAAVEALRTRSRWLRHLQLHRADRTLLACVCEFQMGRFRKGQRLGGCGNPRCWVCHSAKLGGEPTMKQLRSIETFKEGLAEALLANNTFERSQRHRGPPPGAQEMVRPASAMAAGRPAQLGR
jgi:hypothetical protein